MYREPSAFADWPFYIAVAAFFLTFIAFHVAKRRYYRERGRRQRYENHVRILQGAAAEAREAFYRYHDLHIAKATPEGDAKAKANLDLGEAMSRALRQTGYAELQPLQQAFVNMSRKMERERDRSRARQLDTLRG